MDFSRYVDPDWSQFGVLTCDSTRLLADAMDGWMDGMGMKRRERRGDNCSFPRGLSLFFV